MYYLRPSLYISNRLSHFEAEKLVDSLCACRISNMALTASFTDPSTGEVVHNSNNCAVKRLVSWADPRMQRLNCWCNCGQ
jgi:hypothetical protein